MDGTANLIYLLAAKESESRPQKKALTTSHGAIVRGDLSERKIALVFTGDLFGDGGDFIANTLGEKHIKASFFLTGNFYRSPTHESLIRKLKMGNHYLGAHSDRHLLYCDWANRDSTLITRREFENDLSANYEAMNVFGIDKRHARYFLPPYEWYNDSIAIWTKAMGLQLVNLSPGTLSHADYTTPDMKNYRSSDVIFQSIKSVSNDLNGFILLLHIGTDPGRKDKFYDKLPELLQYLESLHYEFVTIPDLLAE
jgi:peptidoglycan/xylan/chitin deacetylase (PgdA/CDA1 family)